MIYLGIRKCLLEEVTLDLRLKEGPIGQGIGGRKNTRDNRDDMCKGPGVEGAP